MLTALMRSGFLSGVANTLIVSEDDRLPRRLAEMMRDQGFEIRVADRYDHADAVLREELIELSLVDYMTDPQRAIGFCRRVRRDPNTCGMTIVFVGQGVAEAEVVEGLWVGADAFVDLSGEASVLVAQLKSLIRRQAAGVCRDSPEPRRAGLTRSTVRIGRLMIDPRRYQAYLDSKPLELTVGEFRMLHVLALRPGEVLSRDQIIHALHGHESEVGDRAIDARMYSIRKRLGEASDYIETVRGVGYRLRLPEPPATESLI